MIMWLDHKCFGNGKGLASPYFDDKFFWLSGELYHYSPGFGAQLFSFQWTHPHAGEERTLCGRTFRVFNSSRRGPRVMVSWHMVEMPRDVNAANAALRLLEDDLHARETRYTPHERHNIMRAALSTEGGEKPEPEPDTRWPNGCRKPNSCARHRQCIYAMRKDQCRYLGENIGPDIDRASTEGGGRG